jgi:tRNA dimethylallyltransferase
MISKFLCKFRFYNVIFQTIVFMSLYGLIGYPLSHSFSKRYFTEKFEREGISAHYELFELPTVEGLPALLAELAQLDEVYFAQVDQANPQRVVRALEVCLTAGKPYSSFRAGKRKERPFQVVKIGLTLPREQLYARIEARMELMLADGLREEAKALLPLADLPALQTVGYQEIFSYLKGEYDWAEAHRLLMRNSRRYAKRQYTWFNRDADVHWFEAGEFEAIINTILAV